MKEPKSGEPFPPCMLLDGALIPETILRDSTLSTSARLLCGILAEYQGQDVEYFPLEEALAGFLGVKVRQLQSYIQELAQYTRGDPPQRFPLIEVKRVWGEKEAKTRNIYNLLWQPFLAVNLKANTAEEGRPAERANAQYPAHRFEGQAQDTTPAPPARPTKDGVTADGRPRGDTQSPAHRSKAKMHDTTAGWAAIPCEEGNAQYFAHRSGGAAQGSAASQPAVRVGEGGTVRHSMSLGDGGARAIYTNSQQLGVQQPQPLAPALDRDAFRPLGPGDCMRHTSTGRCKTCGATVKPVHIMVRVIDGTYCERCCPACHAGD
jgi:hypothetical protein